MVLYEFYYFKLPFAGDVKINIVLSIVTVYRLTRIIGEDYRQE